MNKKRVMLVNEASFLSTGYSTYGLELMNRLFKSEKYELLELSCCATSDDVRFADIPWNCMSAMPEKGNEEEQRIYDSNPLAEHGAMRFEQACLAFNPDIVIDFRDWWAQEYQSRSPFRRNFHWMILTTVDASPQEKQWLATFLEADSVFTYTEFGYETLKRQAPEIKLVGVASAGSDLVGYYPKVDKAQHRQKFGIEPDAVIIGSVMRNQKRKLFPDLIEGFAKFLKSAPKELANRAFLYLHTVYPDLGWDIPSLLHEYGVSHKTLMSYHCMNCGKYFPNFFSDSRSVCGFCNTYSARFPGSGGGLSRESMCDVYNLFDVYVQFSLAEGQGIPMVEAAGCGVPVMAVNYSGMESVVRNVSGIPINVQRFFTEAETGRKMALPDIDDFVEKLTSFLLKPQPIRAKYGREARKGVEKYYDWDKTAARWMKRIDEIEVPDHSETWLSPPKVHEINENVPQGLTNEEFVAWGLINVAGRPDLLNSYMAMRMSMNLNWGVKMGHGMGGVYQNDDSTLGFRQRLYPFGPEDAMNVFREMAEKNNHWERVRANKIASAG